LLGFSRLTDTPVIRVTAGGANRALTRAYRGIEPNHQGNIVLSFVPIKNFAIVSALEVIQESH
jgi:hypothetical protein